MNVEVLEEARRFWICLCWGMASMVYYDVFRIGRRMGLNRCWMVVVQDMTFSLGLGVIILCLIHIYFHGVVRGYMLVGLGIGMLLYNYGISALICRIVQKIKKNSHKLLKRYKKNNTITVINQREGDAHGKTE